MTTPSLSASEVGHLLALAMGPATDDLTEALDGFLPSMANELERRGLDPLQDDVPSCSRFHFLQELRQSMTAQLSH